MATRAVGDDRKGAAGQLAAVVKEHSLTRATDLHGLSRICTRHSQDQQSKHRQDNRKPKLRPCEQAQLIIPVPALSAHSTHRMHDFNEGCAMFC